MSNPDYDRAIAKSLTMAVSGGAAIGFLVGGINAAVFPTPLDVIVIGIQFGLSVTFAVAAYFGMRTALRG